MGFWPDRADLSVALHQNLDEKRANADEAIRRAIATVKGELGDQLLEAGDLTETIDTNGEWLLQVTQRPLVAITSVVVDGTEVLADHYEIADADVGTFRHLYTPFGYRGSKAVVTYEYGFVECPEDLRGVVLDLAIRAFTNPQGKQSNSGENYGTVAFRLFPGELSRTEQRVVNRYKGTPSGRLQPPVRNRLYG